MNPTNRRIITMLTDGTLALAACGSIQRNVDGRGPTLLAGIDTNLQGETCRRVAGVSSVGRRRHPMMSGVTRGVLGTVWAWISRVSSWISFTIRSASRFVS